MTLPTLTTPYGLPWHCCKCEVGWHATGWAPRCWSCDRPGTPGDVRYGHLWTQR